MSDDETFVRTLVHEVPALRPALGEHMSTYGELLTHVFFGDVSRWAVATNRANPSSRDLTRCILLLDAERRSGNAATRELIDASFIENICGESALAAQLLPTLADRYRVVCGNSS